MTKTSEYLTDAPLAGTLVATDFDGWTPELRAEFDAHSHDGYVGSRLLSENERVRVWEIRLAPGERFHAHRHVLDYFWTAVNVGTSRQHTADGTTRDVSYDAGETRHFTFAAGEFLLHDIENVGAGDLVFTTVEHLDSANPGLPL
jgi:beta-alanine degradation protein BauB